MKRGTKIIDVYELNHYYCKKCFQMLNLQYVEEGRFVFSASCDNSSCENCGIKMLIEPEIKGFNILEE